MYSALLVVPDRKRFNADVEKVVLLGGSGPASAGFGGAPLELNRSTNPLPMTLKVGTKYRFRLIDISPNDTRIVSLRGDDRACPVEGGGQGRRGPAAGSGHVEGRQSADLRR